MKNLEILIPFAIPPKELQKDLQKQLQLPAFSRISSRASLTGQQAQDMYCKALAHENCLSGQFPATAEHNSPPVALQKMHEFQLAADSGYWFVIEPVHIHIARDHLVLTDKRQLQLQPDEAGTLFAMAAALAAETGMELRYGDAATWFLRADDWQDLQSATSDAACGHNIDIWMPSGASARSWRKFQNEVQMHWFDHPINQQREQAGQRSINSIWLSGGAGNLPTAPARRMISGQAAGLASQPDGMLLLDQLISPAVNNNWGDWIDQFQQLEQDWFAPCLQQLEAGQLQTLTLLLSDACQLRTLSLNRWDLKKFWRPTGLGRAFGAAP